MRLAAVLIVLPADPTRFAADITNPCRSDSVIFFGIRNRLNERNGMAYPPPLDDETQDAEPNERPRCGSWRWW
jgi:hypothetical protein